MATFINADIGALLIIGISSSILLWRDHVDAPLLIKFAVMFIIFAAFGLAFERMSGTHGVWRIIWLRTLMDFSLAFLGMVRVANPQWRLFARYPKHPFDKSRVPY